MPLIAAIGAFAALMFLAIAAQALVLWLAAKWLKIERVGYLRALGVCLLLSLFVLATGVVEIAAEDREASRSLEEIEHQASTSLPAVYLLLFVISIGGAWCLVKWLLRAPWWRALAAYLITLVPGTAIGLVLATLLRSFLLEAFIVPSGGMAPTIYGAHCDVTCDNCGYGYAISMNGVDPPSHWGPIGPPESRCPNCGRPYRVPRDVVVRPGDRIEVDKTVAPRRWDVVLFRYPRQPSQNFVKRLVGLPGETLEIADGDVFINNERLRKEPAEATDLWFFVHDTDYRPYNVAADTPGWKPAPDGSGWRQGKAGWRCESAGPQPDVLRFTGELNDELAYNYREGPQDRRATSLPTGDVKVECWVAGLSGDGTLGFRWAFRGREVTATVSPSGRAEIAAASEADEEREPQTGQGRMSGDFSAPTRLSFVFRDGWAYLMENDDPIVSLDVGPSDVKAAKELAEQPAQPCRLEILAQGCSVELSRIRISKDVCYRDLHEFPFFNPAFIEEVTPLPVVLGPSEYFVLGDNTTLSRDSRFFGPVEQDTMIGLARWTYWPPSRWHEFQ